MRDYADTAAELRARASIVTDSYDVDPYNAEKTAMLMEDAADAIEELLAKVPTWISVEDELPHYLDHVLCVNKYGIQMVGYLTDYKEGGFRCESGMDSCDYITHWMPLPAPPNGVE